MAATPVLEIENLTIAYATEAGPVVAVRDAYLTVGRNESVGLVGESGSGKSTLAMGAIRYLAENGRILSGRVRLNGEEIQGLPRSAMRKLWGSRISVVYQNPLTALNPALVVGARLAEVASLHLNLDRRAAWARALEMLAKVAMPDPAAVAQRYPHQLSGGMLQRCVIAMALMTEPELLILDEPTTALDVTTQAVVLDLVADLKREFDAAILYITHDLGVVARICDRIGVLYAGEFLEQGPLRPLFQHPLHPYTLNLLGCVPRFEAGETRRSLVTIPGSIPSLDALPPGCVFAPRCDFAEAACRATRPPFVEARGGRWSACRRWAEVPPLAAHLAEVTEEEAPRSIAGAERLLDTVEIRKDYPAPARLFGRATRKTLTAVDDVSLWIDQGRTLGVVGESGSGKTTLARAVIGLVMPSGGEVRLHGDTLAATTSRRPRDVLRRIQMVFQNPDASLNPLCTVGEAIGRPVRLLTEARGEAVQRRVSELLEAVQLPPAYAARLPRELSGGEKQRVAIARAFAAEPELVLCDEAISAMDVSVQGSLMNLLLDLQADQNTSYLFIAHDLAAVQHLSDWIAVVYLGAVVEWGGAGKVLSPPFHPYTEALLSAIPVADPDVEQRSIRLEGSVPSPLDIPSGCRFHTRCPRVLGEPCRTQAPPRREGADGHWIWCHLPLEELALLQANTLVRRTDSDPEVG